MSEYEKIESARMRHERIFTPVVLRALGVQYAQAIAAMRAGIETPENLIRETPVSEAFRRMYSDTGLWFAKDAYRRIDRLTKDRATELTGSWLDSMRAYIATTGARQVRRITDTTRRLVRSAIDDGAAKGWPIPRIATELQKTWRNLSRSRSIVIARTETLSASNAGSISAARHIRGTLPDTQVVKVWLATSDARTRDSHRAANGQERDIDEDFIVNGVAMAHPGDPKGGAGNVILCRCAMTYRIE